MNRSCFVSVIPAVLLSALVVTSLQSAELDPPALKPGNHDYKLNHDGRERSYLLHVPPQYDGTKALPLVLFFHGGFGTAKHASESYGWNEKADTENFLVAYPNGTGSIQTWNAMHGCGSAHRSNVDDVGFVKALLQDLNAKAKVDPKRIYATGMSNGAMLSHRLGSEMSDVFAAVAPAAGSIGGKANANAPEKRIAAPANPVPIIIFHGKADQNVLYEGGQSKSGAESNRIDLSVADAVAFWVKANGCEAAPKKEESHGGNVIKEEYRSASGADVVLYTIVDGGHAWPGGRKTKRRIFAASSNSISATDAAWDFFEKHPRK
jgi:polyhydroxybutyrate depolymerase